MKKGLFVVLSALILAGCGHKVEAQKNDYLQTLKNAYIHHKNIPSQKLKEIRGYIRENVHPKGPIVPVRNIKKCDSLVRVYYAYIKKREMLKSINEWN